MNILFVNTPSDFYGSSRSLIRLSTRLANDGNKVVILLDSHGPIEDYLKHSNIHIIIDSKLCFFSRKKFKRFTSLLSLFLTFPLSTYRIVQIIKKHKIQIVHSNVSLLLTGGVSARIAGIPHFWHIREFFDDFPTMWKYYQHYMQYFSTNILCVSNSIADQFKNQKKIIVLNNGFPKNEFKEVENERIESFKDKFNLNKKILFAVIGRIKFVRKGQEVFVKSAALLKDKYPNVRFLVVGTPSPDNEIHLTKLKELIYELNVIDSVILTGEITDIKAVYAAIDVCVLPSVAKEPFGGVVIEAMAMGKPVIGTNHGGTCDQIDDGITGFLIIPNNVEQLAMYMEKLILDEEQRIMMGKNGQEKFLRNFEFESFYNKIYSLYQKSIKA